MACVDASLKTMQGMHVNKSKRILASGLLERGRLYHHVRGVRSLLSVFGMANLSAESNPPEVRFFFLFPLVHTHTPDSLQDPLQDHAGGMKCIFFTMLQKCLPCPREGSTLVLPCSGFGTWSRVAASCKSVLKPGPLKQDGVCLARVHDLHQHVQRATVHAEGDRECRGLLRVALQLSLFDAAAAPPDPMHRQEASMTSRRCSRRGLRSALTECVLTTQHSLMN